MKSFRYNEIFANFRILAFYMQELNRTKQIFNSQLRGIGRYNSEHGRAKQRFNSKIKWIQPKLEDCVYEIVRFNNDFHIKFPNWIPGYKLNNFVSIYKHKTKKCYMLIEHVNGPTARLEIKYSINYYNFIKVDFNLDKTYYDCILDGNKPSFNRKKTEAIVKKVVRNIIKSA